MQNLYIDFDGVMLDTITTSYKLLEQKNIDRNDLEKTIKFYESMDWNEVIRVTPILNDSIKCLERIKNSNRFHISILTHVTCISEMIAKINFIRKYFDDIDVISCPKRVSKAHMVKARNGILIDDYSGNLKEWENAGGIPIKFSATKKSCDYLCIDHLDQVLEIF